MQVRLSGTMTVLVGLGLLLGGLAPAARAANKDSAIIEASVEVWALQALRDLDLTKDQMRVLKGLSENTSTPLGDRETPTLKDVYADKIQKLRDALEKGTEGEQIDNLQDDIDTMRDDDDFDLDDSVAITPAARAKVPVVLKILTSAQIASYIAAYEDEAPDPVQTLLDAVDDVRGSDEEDARSTAEETADEVAALIAGLDPEKQKPVAEKVRSYLDRAWRMKEGEYKKKKSQLERDAKEIVGEIEGFVILRHWIERDVAELLSNPLLNKAIEARLKAPVAPDRD